MGLNVDTEFLRNVEGWPEPVVQAVERMAALSHGQAVRPSNARSLVRECLGPLAPGLDWSELIPLQHPAWNDIVKTGRAIEAEESRDIFEVFVGRVLVNLPEWAKTRPRRATGERFRTYCELCWRHVGGGSKFCSEHDPVMNQAGYRRARRMLYQQVQDKCIGGQGRRQRYTNEFRKWTNAIRQRDRIEANTDWQKVIDGAMPLHVWLQKHRPLVVELLGETTKLDEGISAEKILSVLDAPNPDVQSHQTLNRHNATHAEIVNNLDQLAGMLVRAEAWLLARNSYRKKHKPGRPGRYRKNG